MKFELIFLVTSSWHTGSEFYICSNILWTFLSLFEWGTWCSSYLDFAFIFFHITSTSWEPILSNVSQIFFDDTFAPVAVHLGYHRALASSSQVAHNCSDMWSPRRNLNLIFYKHPNHSLPLFSNLGRFVLKSIRCAPHAIIVEDHWVGHSAKILVRTLEPYSSSQGSFSSQGEFLQYQCSPQWLQCHKHGAREKQYNNLARVSRCITPIGVRRGARGGAATSSWKLK